MSAMPLECDGAGEAERIEQHLFDRLRREGFVISIDRECDALAVACVLSVKTKTLRNWRDLGCGPVSRTVRGVAWYPLRALAEWIVAQGRPVLECARPRTSTSPPEVSHR